MKNVDVLPHIRSARILRGRSLLAHQTLLARSVCYTFETERKEKIRTHFRFGKLGSDYTGLVR